MNILSFLHGYRLKVHIAFSYAGFPLEKIFLGQEMLFLTGNVPVRSCLRKIFLSRNRQFIEFSDSESNRTIGYAARYSQV